MTTVSPNSPISHGQGGEPDGSGGGFCLPTIESVDRIPLETLPAHLSALSALQARIAARLVLALLTPKAHATDEGLLDVHEAARRLVVTEDWLRRRPDLPFVRKLSDGVVRYDARELARWVSQRRPG